MKIILYFILFFIILGCNKVEQKSEDKLNVRKLNSYETLLKEGFEARKFQINMVEKEFDDYILVYEFSKNGLETKSWYFTKDKNLSILQNIESILDKYDLINLFSTTTEPPVNLLPVRNKLNDVLFCGYNNRKEYIFLIYYVPRYP